jgi:hypothetical protein
MLVSLCGARLIMIRLDFVSLRLVYIVLRVKCASYNLEFKYLEFKTVSLRYGRLIGKVMMLLPKLKSPVSTFAEFVFDYSKV